MRTAPCEGAVVAITGAARGLGRAYAIDAGRAGAHLVLNDVDVDALCRLDAELAASGCLAELVPGAVQDPQVGERIVSRAVTRFGRLDALINNAGIRVESASWAEDPEAARRVVEVNLLGTLMCGIPALARMRDQRSGSVVNVSSRAQSGIHASATYSATKGGLASLTYSWALDMHPYGVRVNAIAPQAGGTGTRRASTSRDEEPRPEDMSPLVLYLISAHSSWVTGQVIRFGLPRDDGIGLALMTHPRQNRAAVREKWTLESIAAHFDTALVDALEPVGADRVRS